MVIVHEWNTIPHLNDYEGDPEARPFTREELQRFLDYADEQVDRAVAAKRKGALAAYRDATLFKVLYGCAGRRRRSWMWPTSAATRPRRSSARNARGFANPQNQARRVRMATTRAARKEPCRGRSRKVTRSRVAPRAP